MANILGFITVNDKNILEVDADPAAGGGTAAPIGSLAMLENGGAGSNFIKIGAADTAWDTVSTVTTSGVGQGTYLRLPIYDMSPNGYHIDDEVAQNGFMVDVAVQAQAGRLAAIEYRIPNPGNSITTADFILSEGAQTKNGDMTFNNNVIVQGNFTVNGALTYLNTTNTNIQDALITLNKGGGAGSAGGSGFEIEENSLITGYIKVAADRNGYEFLAPNVAFKNDLDLSNLTAARVQKFADTSGTFVMRPNGTPGVNGQIGFFSDANNLISAAGLTWNTGSSTLTATNITASTSLTVSTFTLGSVIFAGAAGLLSQNNANFFWDNTNARLGLATTTPSRLLDVAGTSLFRGALRIAVAASPKANHEILQGQVSTTNATPTTIATIAVPTDSVMLITANITARRTGGVSGTAGDSATFVRTVKVKNVGGTVTAPVAQADYTSEDVKAYDANLSVTGTDLLIKVTGVATTNIDWTVTYFVQSLS